MKYGKLKSKKIAMKIMTISKTVFALALTFSVTSFASEKKEIGTNSTTTNPIAIKAAIFQLSHSNKVKLAVDKGTGSRLRVVLKDKGGRMLYSEMYSKYDAMYRRVFDLEDLGDGIYFFELGYDDQRIVKEIEIQTNRERVISIQ